MSVLSPAAVFGLEVPAGEVLVRADGDIPASVRITMAAIDPTAEPEGDAPHRATLKLIRRAPGYDEDEDEDDEDIKALLNGDDEDSESSDEEMNGGPSDPSKSGKARRETAAKATLEAAQAEMDLDEPSKKDKGKGKLVFSEDSDNEDGGDMSAGLQSYVLCTLNPIQHFQQPLDITINEKERVFFQVSGSHAIYLTGNYLLDESGSESDGDYNMPEDFGLASDDEIEYDNESDELDELEDPRITELHSDAEEETPQLVAPNGKKRRASDSEDGLDEIIAQSMKPETNGEVPNGEAKLSKKQRKKLKLQGGSASVDSKPAENGSKKVQFAKNLEQGPTPKKSETLEEEKPTKKEETGGTEKQKKPEAVKQKPKAKAEKEILEPADSKDAGGRKSSVKTVKGVIIDDRVSGEGSRAKKGSKVQLRFIEKLADGKVVEANKKGKPKDIKVGAGEVIEGWDIGLEGIMRGGERRLTIPAHMAYDNKTKAKIAKRPDIPANSQVIIDIKCLAVE